MELLRILLVVPPFPARTYPGKTMGPDYLAAAVSGMGVEVDIYDADIYGTKQLETLLITRKPDLIGITNMSFQADDANDISALARTVCPRSIILKGGAHEVSGYEYTLDLHGDDVDLCVIGEGEQTFVDIIKSAQTGQLVESLPHIAGVAWRSNGSTVLLNTPRPFLPDIDNAIPRRLRFHQSYNLPIFHGQKTAQMLTTRGCKGQCFFCSESTGSKSTRRRSEESIRAEMEELKRDGYEAIYIDDATFTEHRDHALLVARLMKYYRFAWACNTRVDALDRHLVMELAAYGCVYIFCGVESIIPGVLLGLNKTLDPKKYIQSAFNAYKWFDEAGIPRSVFLIFGGPKVERFNGKTIYTTETWQDIEETLRVVLREFQPDYLSMNILRFLPNVPHSFASKFAYLRPNNDIVHAGFYDRAWYKKTHRNDLRSKHNIFNAFEGKASVHPPHIDIETCYNIVLKTMELANEMYDATDKSVQIVLDSSFTEKYVSMNGNHYLLAPLKEMSEG